jgi:succinate dehydrogenase/fumarate reductase flavoprotein subunit
LWWLLSHDDLHDRRLNGHAGGPQGDGSRPSAVDCSAATTYVQRLVQEAQSLQSSGGSNQQVVADVVKTRRAIQGAVPIAMSTGQFEVFRALAQLGAVENAAHGRPIPGQSGGVTSAQLQQLQGSISSICQH